MAVELMGNYGKDYTKVSEATKIKQSSKANTKTSLELNDFIRLMAAQLRNQDMNNPLNESEMMAQMAQMATVQAMTTFTDVAVTTYSASLVGKEVTLAHTEGEEMKQLIGKVTGAGLYNGKQIIFVGGKSYNLSQIMAVGELPDSENAIRVDEKGNKISKGGKKSEIGSKTADEKLKGDAVRFGDGKEPSDLARVLGYDPFAPAEESEENTIESNSVSKNPIQENAKTDKAEAADFSFSRGKSADVNVENPVEGSDPSEG